MSKGLCGSGTPREHDDAPSLHNPLPPAGHGDANRPASGPISGPSGDDMSLATLDWWAHGYTSWLHGTTVAAKWALIGSAVTVAIWSQHPLTLATAVALLAAALASTPLPLRVLVIAAVAPLLFFGLYAVGMWDTSDPRGSAIALGVVLGKGMVTTLAWVGVAATTPYPRLFGPLLRFLPRILSDGLLLSYRALFLLFDRAGHLWLALRLRAGLSRRSLRHNGRALGGGMALLLVQAFDLSQRTYEVLHLRGYQGRLGAPVSIRPAWTDAWAMLLAAALVGLTVAERLHPAFALRWLPWLAALVAAILLTVLVRRLLARTPASSAAGS